MMLGDVIEGALMRVGLTKERFERWLGRPCGCEARQQKLNRLHAWAARVVSGKVERAEEHLIKLTEEE